MLSKWNVQESLKNSTVELEDYMCNFQGSAKSVVPETTNRKGQGEVNDVTPVVSEKIMITNLHVRENNLSAIDVTPIAVTEAAPKVTDAFSTRNQMVQTCSRKSTSTKNANNSPLINSKSEAKHGTTHVKNNLKEYGKITGVSDIRTSTPLVDITTETHTACDPVTLSANSTVWATPAESPVTTGDSLSTSANGR